MTDCKTVQLGEILTSVSRPEGVDPTQTYNILGARWYAKGLYIKERKKGSQIQANTVYRVEKGDLVYNRLFAWKGSFALADENAHGCYVSNEFPCFAVKSSDVLPTYLFYYFSQESWWNQALGLSTGGTPTSRNRLKEASFLALEVPLPTLKEQQRIASLVGKASDLISEAQELRSTAKIEGDALIVNTHLHLARQRTRKLGDLVHLDEDSIVISPEGSYPQVGVRSFGAGLFPKGPVAGTATTYKAFNRLYAGALVLSQVKAWEGAISVCPDELDGWFVSPEYRTFRCIKAEASHAYLAALVKTEWFWSKLLNATRGVGARRERTRPEEFLNIEIPMPEVSVQGQGEALFAEVARLKELQVQTDSELTALLPSVLSKVLSRGAL